MTTVPPMAQQDANAAHDGSFSPVDDPHKNDHCPYHSVWYPLDPHKIDHCPQYLAHKKAVHENWEKFERELSEKFKRELSEQLVKPTPPKLLSRPYIQNFNQSVRISTRSSSSGRRSPLQLQLTSPAWPSGARPRARPCDLAGLHARSWALARVAGAKHSLDGTLTGVDLC